MLGRKQGNWMHLGSKPISGDHANQNLHRSNACSQTLPMTVLPVLSPPMFHFTSLHFTSSH
jgi:hypothetical protein